MVSLLKTVLLLLLAATCSAAVQINDSGTWRLPTTISVNDAGTWRTIQEIYVNDAGTWRTVYSVPDTTPPSVPTGLNAVSGATINISWNASTDNVAVTSYQLQECTNFSCTSPTTVYNGSGLSTTRASNPPGTYYYRVRATDAAFNSSAYSAVDSATTP
jgi:hypothetical protein